MVGIKYADFLSLYVYIVEIIAFSCSCCLIKIIGRSFLEMSFSVSDNYLLLQPFCTKAQFLNGKAKQDMTEKLAGT